MWIGTHLGGLNKLDLRTNRFTVYRMKAGDLTTLPSDIVRDIVPYGDKLIIATQNGVCLFNPATGTCEHLSRIPKKAEISVWWPASTSTRTERYGFPLPERAYILTASTPASSPTMHTIPPFRTLSATTMSTTSCRTATVTCGSPLPEAGSTVTARRATTSKTSTCRKTDYPATVSTKYSSRPYKKGDLLLITNQGFSQFDYPQKKFYNYGTENGFPLTAVNENALFVTHDGEVFLGGIQGMISFWEKKLHFTPKSYSIILSRLLVNGKEITAGDDTGILEQSIAYTPEISLKADQSMFSIEYATSNFIPANRNEIVYRLEGFSDEWNHTDRKQTLITYTNLNPGKYTLVIKSDGDGIEEARLLIRVLPPWYETWWAYLIYTICTVSLLWYLIQNYNSRIKLRESLKYEKKHIEDLEALNQSKLRFFTNISHEFRTPLTLIVGQVETLLQVQTFTPNIYHKILGIYKNSLQLRELITELLDFRKQEQGHMKIKVSRHNLVNFLYENSSVIP